MTENEGFPGNRPPTRVTSRLARRAALLVPPIGHLVEQRDRLRTTCHRLREERDRACRERDTLRAERDALVLSVAGPGREERSPGAGSAAEEEPALEYLFVLTYGRSGSTLLQNLLNSIPGVLVRGENHGVLYELYRFHHKVLHHRDRLARPQPLPPFHPWWGIDGYPEEEALAAMRRLVLDTLIRPRPDSRIVGFKEITWPDEDLAEYVAFLRRLFPGARFVFNTRDLADVARSKWWATMPDAAERLARTEKRMSEVVDGLGDAAVRVHYDDYCADPEALRPMHRWLGGEFDAERIRTVMAVRHSY
ncbi:sulfotransferase [Streptomyces sp. PD-S100-1]|uniref:sulfotransferase n=1 Tax=Streptomyces sp. PD-S100-1 TaxID=3394351 RepID=UPI001406E412|nr:sulfotransferase [Streptomyces sp. SID9944]